MKLHFTILKYHSWYLWLCYDYYILLTFYFYRVFSHDVTAAILVCQNNEMAAMLVSQTSPLGVELFSYANAFISFAPINLHRCWPFEWKCSINTFVNNFSDTFFLSLFSEVLGALVSVLIIWVLTGVLVYLAVQRVITQDFDINADIMLITAGIGLGVNIL